MIDEMQWDSRTAAETAQTLSRIADRLDALTRERALLAQTLLDEWQGARRSEFDERFDLLLRRSLQLAAYCRQQAGRVALADDQYRVEQQQRERLRRGI
jgi:hypothetical protein